MAFVNLIDYIRCVKRISHVKDRKIQDITGIRNANGEM